MDQIPDWLMRWLYTKAIDLAVTRFWKSYGRAWLHSGDQSLLRFFVWHQVALNWLAWKQADWYYAVRHRLTEPFRDTFNESATITVRAVGVIKTRHDPYFGEWFTVKRDFE